MNQTAVAVTDVAAIDHDEAMALAATEYTRFSALVDSLAGADWNAPTDCTEWTVRDMVLHVLGTAEGSASAAERNSDAMRSSCLVATLTMYTPPRRSRSSPVGDATKAIRVPSGDHCGTLLIASALSVKSPCTISSARPVATCTTHRW